MKDYSLGNVIRAMGWGVLLGGGAGFLLGMLLAPEEGRQLRRRLTYRLERLAKQVGEVADQMLSSEAESEARRTGNALVADARVRAQRIRSDIDALLGEVREPEAPRSPSRQDS